MIKKLFSQKFQQEIIMSISKEGKCLVCGSERIDQSCIYYWSDDDNGGADYKKDMRYCIDCFDRSSAEQQYKYERAAHRAWARSEINKGENK
jgi:hypothetical protein